MMFRELLGSFEQIEVTFEESGFYSPKIISFFHFHFHYQRNGIATITKALFKLSELILQLLWVKCRCHILTKCAW